MENLRPSIVLYIVVLCKYLYKKGSVTIQWKKKEKKVKSEVILRSVLSFPHQVYVCVSNVFCVYVDKIGLSFIL